MISSLQSRKSLFWALCIVLLVVRFAGAHWHLCYDGSEQPRAVHIGEMGVGEMGMGQLHAGEIPAGTGDDRHVDTDLNLVESGLAKYFKSMHELPALLAALALLLLVLPRRGGVAPLPLVPLPWFSLRHHPAVPRAPPR
jgi:hypothetical protein